MNQEIGELERRHWGQPNTPSATVTHTIVDGHTYPIKELPRVFGFDFNQLSVARRDKYEERTFCVIGGRALSLYQFELTHPQIVLGEN